MKHEPECHYIAGFFDGEGCVRKNGYQLSITNSDKFLLDYVSQYLSKLNIKHRICREARKNPKHSKIYKLWISGRTNIEKFKIFIPIKSKDKIKKLNDNLKRYKYQTPDIEGDGRIDNECS